ncbi:hypothetical protein M3J09_011869 [Ascochyta lentis]
MSRITCTTSAITQPHCYSQIDESDQTQHARNPPRRHRHPALCNQRIRKMMRYCHIAQANGRSPCHQIPPFTMHRRVTSALPRQSVASQ